MSAVGPRPTPAVDRDSVVWWRKLARHQLVVDECDACGRLRWPTRDLCPRCGSRERSDRHTGHTGTVASWIVNHHEFGPWLEVPYVVLLVRLDDQDDLLLPGSFDGDSAELRIGLPVELACLDIESEEPDAEGTTLLSWRVRKPERGLA